MTNFTPGSSPQDETEAIWQDCANVLQHELLRTFSHISGCTELLLLGKGGPGPLTEVQEAFLKSIRKNVKESKKLLSLITLAAIETASLPKNLEVVKLATCVEQAVASLQGEMTLKNQNLTVELSPLSPLLMDKNRLVQILVNILENAHRYTYSGGEIKLTTEKVDEFVKIVVIDTGIGIATQDQKFIFQTFYRGADRYIQEQEGIGLGLTVTKRLVEYFGGTIGVESEIGKGSKFWFALSGTAE